MKVVPFIPGHADAIMARADAKIGILSGESILSYGRMLFAPGLSYSAMTDNGKLLGSGGIIPLHRGVGDAWAVFSTEMEPGASRQWLRVDRAVRLFLHGHLGKDFWRLQTYVRSDFEHGHKWAARLGFTSPAQLHRWGPDGADYHLYGMTA